MDSQPEFFGALPQNANPRRDFAEFRVGQKIIQIPCSIWKDGRIRADVSKYGAGEVVSRNATNLQDRVVEILREHFGAIVEAVYQEFSRAGRPKASKPRSSNKRAALQQPPAVVAPKRHINPFVKDVWNFSKAPQWLLIRREPSLAEKLVYARLTYAPREKEEEKICKKDIELGAIFELNQAKLANELGIRRECVCGALKSLRKRGLIDYTGNQGAKGCIRFLWHPWIPETCALNTQVSIPEPVRLDNRSCAPAAQPPVRFSHNFCAQKQQVSPSAEKREYTREERKRKVSSSSYNGPDW
jgi:hypothetical protein